MQPSWKPSPLLFLTAAVEAKIDTRRHVSADTFRFSDRGGGEYPHAHHQTKEKIDGTGAKPLQHGDLHRIGRRDLTGKQSTRFRPPRKSPHPSDQPMDR